MLGIADAWKYQSWNVFLFIYFFSNAPLPFFEWPNFKHDTFNFFFQNSKDSSVLESNKKRKGKLNTKGGKKKKEDLQEVDGEIEAVLQKKGEMEVLWMAAAVLLWARRCDSKLFGLGNLLCVETFTRKYFSI